MLRGLFGSSARQAAPFAPELAGAALNAPAAPAPLLANPEAAAPTSRSYLGGLVKYEPQAGMTGAERMQIIGATLRDIGSGLGGGQGGSLEAVQEGFRARQAKTEKEGLMKRLQQMAGELYPDDEEAQLLFKADPSAFVESRIKAREPDVDYVTRPEGLYRIDKKANKAEMVQEFERSAPSGWEWDGEKLAPIPGGPYDPNYIGQAAGVRRDAVVSRPTPSRARSGGGGGGSRGGSAPASAATPPWKRTW